MRNKVAIMDPWWIVGGLVATLQGVVAYQFHRLTSRVDGHDAEIRNLCTKTDLRDMERRMISRQDIDRKYLTIQMSNIVGNNVTVVRGQHGKLKHGWVDETPDD